MRIRGGAVERCGGSRRIGKDKLVEWSVIGLWEGGGRPMKGAGCTKAFRKSAL